MRNTALLALILTLTIAFVTASCDEEENYVQYINKSETDIYIYKTYNAILILPQDESYMGRIIHRYYRSGRFQSYTDYIYPDYDHEDTLYTTIVSLDTIKKHTWQTVRDRNIILRRDTIPLNKAYLKSIDYTLQYP